VKGSVLPLDWPEDEDPASALVVDEEEDVEVVVPEALVVLDVPALVGVDEVVDEVVVVVPDPLWGWWPASGSTYCEFPAEPPPWATAGPAPRSVNPTTARRQTNDRARNRVGAGIEFVLNQRPETRVFRPG
jgi:hypothetical protein